MEPDPAMRNLKPGDKVYAAYESWEEWRIDEATVLKITSRTVFIGERKKGFDHKIRLPITGYSGTTPAKAIEQAGHRLGYLEMGLKIELAEYDRLRSKLDALAAEMKSKSGSTEQ